MSKTVNIDDDAYAKVAEIAKKDRRPIRQELMVLIDFAYDNINNPVLKVADAMTPQKGMTPEEVKQTPKYKELEAQLTELEKEAYEIEERAVEAKTNEEMLELSNISAENKNKQENIRSQMRAMLNV